jgi:uncharacterized Zn-finger protein
VTQLISRQRLLNLEDCYTAEDRRIPNVLQQMFTDISNATCSANLHAVGTEGHGSQQTDSRNHAAVGGNEFQCTQCGKVYLRKGTLTRHLKFECGKEPQFPCPYCPHRAKQKNHLVKHIASRHKDAI